MQTTNPNNKTIISLQDVGFRYGPNHEVLKDINFELNHEAIKERNNLYQTYLYSSTKSSSIIRQTFLSL